MPVFTEESSPEMLLRAAGLKEAPLPRVSPAAPVNADRTAEGAKHEVVVIGVCTSKIPETRSPPGMGLVADSQLFRPDPLESCSR